MGERISSKQRQWVLDRDNHHSQLRTYSEETGWTTEIAHCKTKGEDCPNLEVHHIEISRKGGETNPSNLITLSKCQHVGICPVRKIIFERKYLDPDREFVVHTDIQEVTKNYKGGNSFNVVFERRNKVLKHDPDMIYHNPIHDIEMRNTAVDRTKRFVELVGRPWPKKKIRCGSDIIE